MGYWKNGIRKKYNEISLPVKTAFWFIVCAFLQKAFGMLSTPIFTRIMDTAAYGEYSVFVSVTTILTVVATLNISSVLATKGINKYPEEKEQFLMNIQILSSASVLVCMIVFLCNRDFVCQITGLNMKTMCFAWGQIFMVPAFEIWSAKQRYDCNYRKILVFTLVYLICNMAVVTASVMLSENKGEARIISSCIVLIVMYSGLYFSNIKCRKKVFNPEMIKFAFRFNLPLIPQGLANQVLSRSDILMIQYFQGTSQSGIYSLGYSIASIIVLFTVSVNNVYVAWLYKKLDVKKFRDIKEKSIIMLEAVFVIVTVIILTAPEIIWFFAPEEYADAVYVIAPVSVGIAFTLVYTLFVHIELYFEKTALVMLGSILVAVVNIVLNALFIPKYGFVAAAYTTLVSYIGYVIIHFLAVLKFCGNRINIFEVYDLKKILLLCIGQIIVLLITVTLYPYRIMRYAVMVFVCLAGVIILKKGGFSIAGGEE